MNIYQSVRDHHLLHGDDFRSWEKAVIRYDTALSVFPQEYDSLLDAGCGGGRFRDHWKQSDRYQGQEYTGIDLVTGTNILDYDWPHDVVVAMGMMYLVPQEEKQRLIRHMWTLARKCLIVQAITRADDGEFPMDPGWLIQEASSLAPMVMIRQGYIPCDITVAMYR